MLIALSAGKVEPIQEREFQMGASYKSAEAQKQTWDGKVTQRVEQWEPPMAPRAGGTEGRGSVPRTPKAGLPSRH